LQEEGATIRNAVQKSLDEGVVTEDLAEGGKAYKTSEVGDYLATLITDHNV
jgi:3-isopropylmalate dehydrogenase